MYIETICPQCGEPIAPEVAINYQKLTTVSGTRIVVKNVEIQNVISLEDLVQNIIIHVKPLLKNGIGVHDLRDYICQTFNVAKSVCCDIIERIKTVLGLYSPDMEHLYFVNV